jgi:hypothetical protein
MNALISRYPRIALVCIALAGIASLAGSTFRN